MMQILFLLTLNAIVGTSTVNVANHKTVNSIVLNMLATEDSKPSSTNLTILSAIAAQCPIAGGDAVYEARSIVERFTGETFDDAVTCAIGNRPSNGRGEGSETVSSTAIALFPNPTSGLLQWTGTEGKVVTIRVFDQLGVLVKEQNVDGQQIDLSLLPNGLYFVHLTDAEGILLTLQKVSLFKN